MYRLRHVRGSLSAKNDCDDYAKRKEKSRHKPERLYPLLLLPRIMPAQGD